MEPDSIDVADGELDPSDLWTAALRAADPSDTIRLGYSDETRTRIENASVFVETLATGGGAVYGLNTGFGRFADQQIPAHQIKELQRNLILSHACAVGELAPRQTVLAMWLLRLRTVGQGRSGIRLRTVDKIMQMLNAGVLGLVPSRGSVGASGDLASAAHALLPLLGEGQCTRPCSGKSAFETVEAKQVLTELGLAPLVLGPKEGLSLINGTHYTTALATQAWYEASQLLRVANMSAAMIMESVGGAESILENNVLATHHPHTQRVGGEMASWLAGSSYLFGARLERRFAQAPYSLRCAPQVHGAVAAELDAARETLREEYDVVSDNPLVFPETREVHSCGNFHAIYAARVCDKIASAVTTLGSITERRINMAMDGQLTGLPNFLVRDGGLHSGLMMLQVTAAALVSECKALSFPASVDSIPTNCDREDHVSMGPIAGHKALAIIRHAEHILAIELLVAAQGLDLRERLSDMPPALGAVHALIRERVTRLTQDRVLAPDVEALVGLIDSGGLTKSALPLRRRAVSTEVSACQ
jgi:histidine ammonia-lyase